MRCDAPRGVVQTARRFCFRSALPSGRAAPSRKAREGERQRSALLTALRPAGPARTRRGAPPWPLCPSPPGTWPPPSGGTCRAPSSLAAAAPPPACDTRPRQTLPVRGARKRAGQTARADWSDLQPRVEQSGAFDVHALSLGLLALQPLGHLRSRARARGGAWRVRARLRALRARSVGSR